MNCVKNTLLIIKAWVTCAKKLLEAEGKKNEDQVYLIKKVLNKMKKKKNIEKVTEDKKSMIEENKNIINIVEHILYFNQLEQKGEGLKNTNTKPNA